MNQNYYLNSLGFPFKKVKLIIDVSGIFQATQRDTEAEDLGKLSNSNEAAKSELEDRSSWWMLPQCYQPYWTPPFAGKAGS